MPDYVLYELDQGVARITLNRPEVLNSCNRGMAAQLQSLLQKAAADEAVRCVLLTGAGRAFCAGQDLAEVSDGTPLGDILEHNYNPVIRLISRMEKPVVCAVNGVAAGAGANIALACDIVLASRKASFIQSFAHIGLIPDSGGTYFLPRLVGLGRARALALLGEKIGADDAVGMGLISRACEAEELEGKALELARHLARQPTRGLGLTKRALRKSLQNDLDSQLELEKELQTMAGNTEDYKEGVKAFLEKRKPRFKGK
ncbi:MAG: enoyl-CoA hydratase-related protein [Acidobacteriota bacterium]